MLEIFESLRKVAVAVKMMPPDLVELVVGAEVPVVHGQTGQVEFVLDLTPGLIGLAAVVVGFDEDFSKGGVEVGG